MALTAFLKKVLYDNAQLLNVYSPLKLGGDALFEDALSSTLDWLMREMRHGNLAGQDGASLGQRGRKHYLWRREQAKKLLDDDAYLLIETLYALDKPAGADNHRILHRRDSYHSVIERLSMDEANANTLLKSAREVLLTSRSERTPPITDKNPERLEWTAHGRVTLPSAARALADELGWIRPKK